MTTFLEYGQTVLDRRAAQGVRGIRSERHRWTVHVSTACFASKPMGEIRAKDIRAWIRDMGAKKAADTRGDRLLTARVAGCGDPTCKGLNCGSVVCGMRLRPGAAGVPVSPERAHPWAEVVAAAVRFVDDPGEYHGEWLDELTKAVRDMQSKAYGKKER